MKNYILAMIAVSGQNEKDILIAELTEIGFEGFEEERATLKAFIPANDFNETSFNSVMQKAGAAFSTAVVEEQNWNAIWEAGFEPVIVGSFCAVRADFHPPVDGVRYEIIITPKMSFGTGHHATTYMMIKMMGEMDFSGKSVFDFGTGTGVLGILAEKCGAASVEAIDNDDWSIENAKENMQRNSSVKLRLTKSDKMPGGRYDVILANINRHVIVQQLQAMAAATAENGLILLSGLLEEDERDIHEIAVAEHLSLINKATQHNWICLMYVSKS
jgi:ribosomal protein L11 methyltransferase